jgi:hypothetical protein
VYIPGLANNMYGDFDVKIDSKRISDTNVKKGAGDTLEIDLVKGWKEVCAEKEAFVLTINVMKAMEGENGTEVNDQ